MIRNEAPLPPDLASRVLSPCRWVAGTQDIKQPPSLCCCSSAWLGVSLRTALCTTWENSVPIKNQALVSFVLQKNKTHEFKLCPFFPQIMSGVETEQC